MFFDQALGGNGGGASAFTSPGMNPQLLALLMAMQHQGGGMGGPGGMGGGGMGAPAPGGPALPATPPANQNAPTGGPIPAPPGPAPMPTPPPQAQQQQSLQQLLQRLQQGGGLAGLFGAGGGGLPMNLLAGLGGPQGGTGGLY